VLMPSGTENAPYLRIEIRGQAPQRLAVEQLGRYEPPPDCSGQRYPDY